MALKQLYTRADVRAVTDEFIERIVFATIEALKDVGEGFIADARSISSYMDRTGNLRSSVGYMILLKGKPVFQVFDRAGSGTDGSEGVNAGRQFARQIARQFQGNRITFIGVAGMNYAVYVEATGRDVITGSSEQAKSLLQRHLKRITRKR